MAGYIGSKASVVSSGAERKTTITATSGQTSLTGLSYTPNHVHVFQNGVRLVDGTDYTATNGSSITLTVGASADDQIVVVSYATYQNADSYTKTEADARYVEGDDTLYVDQANNRVGIGTSSPNRLLHLHTASGSNGRIHFSNGTTGTATSDGFFIGQDSGDGNVSLWNLESDYIRFGTNNSERIRIASNGKIGINETSPSHTLHVNSGTTNIVGKFESTDSVAGIAFLDNAGAAEIAAVGNDLAFYPAGSEKMRLFQNGNLEIGDFNSSGGSAGVKFDVGGGTSETEIQTSVNGTATRCHYAFRNNNGEVGKITTNGSSTTYSTSSDYRLKENVTDVTGGITRLKQLAPKRFNFIADANKTVDGFIAHEVSSVVPEAIAGEKDEVDADGNPKWQGIDQSKLVPLLTAALQEAITKIETLETKVAALEAE